MQTNMTKLETIRQACIEANPEIVELKFGCEVFVERWGHSAMMCAFEGLPELSGETSMTLHHKGKLHYVGSSSKGKIIGRTIRLADVLLALQRGSTNKRFIFITLGGIDGLMDLILLWNLKDDNLDHQSPETIDFIHKLLKNHD